MRSILLLAACLAACTTFDPIADKVCGNGIIEPGEDCDSPDTSTCVACALTCDKTLDCPSGSACGIDGTCHAPGGGLLPSKMIGTVAVNDFRITDVDRDGIGDFLGLSSSSLTVRRGDGVAALQSSQSFVTPGQTGEINFGDLDNDGSLDFVMPTSDGLVEYTSKHGTPSPVSTPFALFDKETAIAAVIPLRPTVIALFLALDASSPSAPIVLTVIDFADLTVAALVPQPICSGITYDKFNAGSLDVYDATATNSTTTSDYVVSFLNGATAHQSPCVFAIHLDPPVTSGVVVRANIADITPPNLGELAHRPILAQLDYLSGDNCPYLVISLASGVVGYDGSLEPLTKHCRFAAASTPIPLADAPTGAAVVGHIRLDPAFFLVGQDALVLTAGLWVWIPAFNSASALYTSTRPLKGAISGDINHDGLVDGILIPEGTDDMDLLIRYHADASPGHPNGLDGYQFRRIDTAGEPSTVLLSDFDGNGFLDVEYTEAAGTDTDAYTRMMIAYGTPDQLLPPVQVGAFDAVGSVVPLSSPSHADPLSLSTDLIVTVPNSTRPLLTVLLGSPQRTMVPLLEPRIGKVAMGVDYQASTFQAAVIGDFVHEADDGTMPDFKQHLDVSAIATSNGAATTTYGWRIENSDAGLDTTQKPGILIPGAVDCSTGTGPINATPGGGGLCANAMFVAVPVMMHDVILGIDRFNRAGVADPSSASPTIAPVTAFAALGTARVNTLLAEDLDGDGAAEIVAGFGPSPGKPDKGVVMVCTADAISGIPHDCRDVATAYVTAVDPTVTACDGVAIATLATTKARDLVVACRVASGTALFRIEPANGNLTTRLPVDKLGRVDLIRAGDINGDGVDDLVVIEGDLGAQTLSVLQQCTTRDQPCFKVAP